LFVNFTATALFFSAVDVVGNKIFWYDSDENVIFMAALNVDEVSSVNAEADKLFINGM